MTKRENGLIFFLVVIIMSLLIVAPVAYRAQCLKQQNQNLDRQLGNFKELNSNESTVKLA